jgi:serine/threonine-protein kinase
VVKGKFSYLSPEAAKGEDVDHRADVFAVGIILWELFTGRRLFYGDTDYQTVELVRQARVPSIAALNPEIEPEIEQVVRKALSRDADDRYQSAGDMADALAQYLFSRRMKVTARDIANLVKDTQVELMRKRSAEPKESLIDALILDEMQKMTSLLDGQGNGAQTSEGSMSLDPSAFVDTSGWSAEMGLAPSQTPSGQIKQKHRTQGTSRPPPTGKGKVPTPPPGELESLEQMLEPDRTGVHKKDNKPPWFLIVAIMLLLAAGAAVAVVVAMQ